MDKSFKFDRHLGHLAQKLGFVDVKLYKLCSLLPKRTLMVYLALAEYLIRYGIATWGNTSYYLLGKIFKLQKNMLRLIAKKNLDLLQGSVFLKNVKF